MTSGQVSNLVASALHALRIGLPLNRMITIHWQSAGVPLHKMTKATGHFLDLITKALARRGHRTAWLWVHESGPDKGGHCHLLIYVPVICVRTIAGRQRAWIKAITGQRFRARVIKSRPVGGLLGLEVGNPPLHAANLFAAIDYSLKGSSSQAKADFGLARHQPGGTIIGKRCGTSQNIGRKARSKWTSTQ